MTDISQFHESYVIIFLLKKFNHPSLYLLLLTILLPGATSLSLAESLQTASIESNTLETLKGLVSLRIDLRQDIETLNKKINETQSEAQKQALKQKLAELEADLQSTTRNFESIAAGVKPCEPKGSGGRKVRLSIGILCSVETCHR